jgi:hypothetical protein
MNSDSMTFELFSSEPSSTFRGGGVFGDHVSPKEECVRLGGQRYAFEVGVMHAAGNTELTPANKLPRRWKPWCPIRRFLPVRQQRLEERAEACHDRCRRDTPLLLSSVFVRTQGSGYCRFVVNGHQERDAGATPLAY